MEDLVLSSSHRRASKPPPATRKRRFTTDDLWTPGPELPSREVLTQMADRLAQAWNYPGISRRVSIAYNTRLRTTIGRAILDDRRVELNTRLLRENPRELPGVLAHELAHIVVYLRYGPVRPHGRQFRQLMRAVGLSAATTHKLKTAHLQRRRRKYLYLHCCDTCGYSFISRRVWRSYYCVACGPGMKWRIFRALNNPQGRKLLKEVKRGEEYDRRLVGKV